MDMKERMADAMKMLEKRKTIIIDGRMDDDVEDIVLACLRKALEHGHKEITVVFNSGGGNWITGIAIYNAILLLRTSGTIVRGVVMASCCSAAAVALQACTTREIMEGSHMLMHWGRSTLNNMEQAELRRGNIKWVVRQINDSNEEMLKILSSRCKISQKKLAKMCDREERIMAKRAVKLGFADKIIDYSNINEILSQPKN